MTIYASGGTLYEHNGGRVGEAGPIELRMRDDGRPQRAAPAAHNATVTVTVTITDARYRGSRIANAIAAAIAHQGA